MKKKNGFTLIELLAVIVILAIIALIATPIILNLINKARQGAAQDAAYGVRKEAQLVYSTSLIEHPNTFDKIEVGFNNGNITTSYYETSSSSAIVDEVKFELDGTKPTSGTITIHGNGRIEYSDIVINGYSCVIPESGKITCGGSSSGSEENSENGSNSGSVASNAPALTLSESGSYATFEIEEDIAGYCITKVNDSTTCDEFVVPEENQTSVTLLGTKGKNYIFLKKTNNEITDGAEFEVAGLPSETFENKNNGDEISLGGYNWHIIGQDDTKIWLLMDAFDGTGTTDSNRQIPLMAHCTDDTDGLTDCTSNGNYYVYSWDKSQIRTYLNTTFYNNLSDEIKSSIVSTEVCSDPSLKSSTEYSYGGYTKSEIESISGATCNNGYTSDKVRLISQSEYYNLTSYYSTTTYPVSAPVGNGKGYIPQVSYITRLSTNNWLYSSTISYWWTMSVDSYNRSFEDKYVYPVYPNGNLSANDWADWKYSVRPVIVLQK